MAPLHPISSATHALGGKACAARRFKDSW